MIKTKAKEIVDNPIYWASKERDKYWRKKFRDIIKRLKRTQRCNGLLSTIIYVDELEKEIKKL